MFHDMQITLKAFLKVHAVTQHALLGLITKRDIFCFQGITNTSSEASILDHYMLADVQIRQVPQDAFVP